MYSERCPTSCSSPARCCISSITEGTAASIIMDLVGRTRVDVVRTKEGDQRLVNVFAGGERASQTSSGLPAISPRLPTGRPDEAKSAAQYGAWADRRSSCQVGVSTADDPKPRKRQIGSSAPSSRSPPRGAPPIRGLVLAIAQWLWSPNSRMDSPAGLARATPP